MGGAVGPVVAVVLAAWAAQACDRRALKLRLFLEGDRDAVLLKRRGAGARVKAVSLDELTRHMLVGGGRARSNDGGAWSNDGAQARAAARRPTLRAAIFVSRTLSGPLMG